MNLIKSTASVLLACIPITCAQAQTWNANLEFSVDHANPNGVWSYGWYPSTLTGPLTLFTLHSNAPDSPLWGAWIAPDSTPAIWKNTSSAAQNGVGVGQLSLHPGPHGEACAVRWTNPQRSQRGTLLARGGFQPGDAGWMQVGVRINDSLEFHAADSGAFELSRDNLEVEYIEFLVWQGYAFGNTPLDVDVIFIPACAGDFNEDGGVDGSDVDTFFAAWESGESHADINEDGGIDGGDVEAFFARWEAGC